MVRTICLILSILLTAGIVFSQELFLADRHKANGLECADCHDEATPQKDSWVEWEKCLSCHGQRKDIAEKTKAMGKFNPHDNHLGEADCMICHHGHEKSSLYCVNCHNNLDPKMK